MSSIQEVENRLLAVARNGLSTETQRRSLDGEAMLSDRAKETLVVGLIQRELAVIDGELVAQGKDQIPLEVQAQLSRNIMASTTGLGPVDGFLRDPQVEEILGYWDRLTIYRSGRKREVVQGDDTPWSSQEELVDWLAFVARNRGTTERSFNAGNPLLVLRLGTGLRLAAQMEVGERVSFALRRNTMGRVTLNDLSLAGMFPPHVRDFLAAAVRLREGGVIFAGTTGAGKTTILRACLDLRDRDDHLVVVEDTRELDLFDPVHHPMVSSWEVRLPNAEGAGGVSMGDLVRHGLRMRPDMMAVGEVRDGEAAEQMLAAMTFGASSWSTVHAKSAVGALDKLQLYLGMSGMPSTVAQQQISSAVDFVVHVRVHAKTGKREISEIVEVAGFDGTQCITNKVYDSATGSKNIFTEETKSDLASVGFDSKVFAQVRGVA